MEDISSKLKSFVDAIVDIDESIEYLDASALFFPKEEEMTEEQKKALKIISRKYEKIKKALLLERKRLESQFDILNDQYLKMFDTLDRDEELVEKVEKVDEIEK